MKLFETTYYNHTDKQCKCGSNLFYSNIYKGVSGVGGYWCNKCNFNHDLYGPHWMDFIVNVKKEKKMKNLDDAHLYVGNGFSSFHFMGINGSVSTWPTLLKDKYNFIKNITIVADVERTEYLNRVRNIWPVEVIVEFLLSPGFVFFDSNSSFEIPNETISIRTKDGNIIDLGLKNKLMSIQTDPNYTLIKYANFNQLKITQDLVNIK